MPTTQSHGVLLTRYLEKQWDARYTNRGTWCRQVGLADSTVLRWGRGAEPDLKQLGIVAEGLSVKLVELLFHAGYIDEDDVKLRSVAPAPQRVPLVDSIRTDSTLTPAEKDALLAVHTAFTSQDGTRRRRRTTRVAS
jgi:hypothetical protein